jgi:hypothetical protein
MEVDVEHATVELIEKEECKRDPEFRAPPLKLPTRGAVYIERLRKPIQQGGKEGRSPTAPENIAPTVFLPARKVSNREATARWAQMGHKQVENFLMHLGRFYLRLGTRTPPDDPTDAARWQITVDYMQQAILGCVDLYTEDMKKRKKEAKPGKKVAPDLSDAFHFYRRAQLPRASNTPATQNNGTDPQDSEVFLNPTMEQERQGVSQKRLQADGLVR